MGKREEVLPEAGIAGRPRRRMALEGGVQSGGCRVDSRSLAETGLDERSASGGAIREIPPPGGFAAERERRREDRNW